MADLFNQRYFVQQDAEAMQRIAETFPEKEVYPAFVKPGTDPNIYLVQDCTVSVTFISEGAGYKNSFGYATFELDENGNPNPSTLSNHQSIFDNASALNAGGDLRQGDTVDLGVFPAGTNIAFYLIANGFNGGTTTYWSLSPEHNPDGLRHVVSVFDLDTQTTFVGFEDLFNGGDKDYNDLLFTVQSDPWTAISREKFATTDDLYPNKIFSRCASCCPNC